MPRHLLHLEARLTHKYVIGWSEEDDWKDVCTIRHTKPRPHSVDSSGDSWANKLLVYVTPQEWEKARLAWQEIDRPSTFVDWMSRVVASSQDNGCRCEHDCCGHTQSYGTAEYLGKRRFSVKQHCYLNI